MVVRVSVLWASIVAATLIAAGGPQAARAGDWPAFRGPNGNGISTETGVPLTWGPQENIRWSVALPGPGNSSPIVANGRVFVTCATEEGRARGLYCYDRRDGRELWSQIVRVEKPEPTHATNPHCGSTPVADGERVIVWHSSGGLYCYDHDGGELWRADFGEFKHIWGYGSSPVIWGDRVFLHCGPGARTFVVCLDKHTGKALWQADEPGGDDDEIADEGGRQTWTGSWSTPLAATIDGREQIIVSLPRHVQAYNPADGAVLWSCDGLGPLVYTSVVASEGLCVAMGGYSGPAIGFKPGGEGNITADRRLWLVKDGNPQRIGSGMIVGAHMFMANEPGIVQCLDAATGRELWKERLSTAKIWGSLVLVEGRFYVTNQEGTTYVFAPSAEKLEVLAENKLAAEMCNSTPAFSDGQVFLRTYGRLYCVGK